MKLYYSPGASSLAVHILLRETALSFSLCRVDLATHLTSRGGDYYEINPHGQVPILELDDGSHLTQQAIIAQYVCDLAGRTDLMPQAGSMERYRVMEWQNHIATELHKGFSPLFWRVAGAARDIVIHRLHRHFRRLDEHLSDQVFLTGHQFTAADAYLFVMASWGTWFELDMPRYPHLRQYLETIGHRASVISALAAEGEGLVISRAYT